MSSFFALQDALYTWATTVSGLTTIFANPIAPKPEKPFLTIFVTPFVEIGDDFIIHEPNLSGDAEIVGTRELTVSIQCMADNPMQILEILKNSLYKPSIQETLRAGRLIFIEPQAINDITTVYEGRYEPRGNLDVLFRTDAVYSDNVGCIESVEITGEYPGHDITKTIIIARD